MCYTATRSTQGTTSLDPWASVNLILLDQRTENKHSPMPTDNNSLVFQQAVSLFHSSVSSWYCQLLKFTQCILGRKVLVYPIYEPRPGTTSPQRDPPIVLQNRPGRMDQMIQHQPSQTTLFERLRSYPFSTDSEFANGLSIILGHPGSPANETEINREDDLVLQAKCFYFSRYGIYTPHAATSLTFISLLEKKVSHHPLTLQPIEPG